MQNNAFYGVKRYFNIHRYAKPELRLISILKLHFNPYTINDCCFSKECTILMYYACQALLVQGLAAMRQRQE